MLTICELARLFPPEVKLVKEPYKKGEQLSSLLRPELVLANEIPLCSDALSLFQSKCPNKRKSNTEVRQASNKVGLFFIISPFLSQQLILVLLLLF